MLQELSWYIETDRFTGIVAEIEAKAQKYRSALLTGNGVEESREEFRHLCQWHMEKSGYKTEDDSFINPDIEFFDGVNINREALNTFEKEIIKAHLYQKHLWEFMGTTGCMTVISQAGMKKDGFVYEHYLPIACRAHHTEHSPLAPILQENPGALPIYLYPDGSISSEYNRDKAKIRFDVLQDTSGFDWRRTGWDPNYEVEKTDWHGAYDEQGNWVMVKAHPEAQPLFSGARIQAAPVLEIIKDGDSGILYDPGFSLLGTFERVYILTNGEIYGGEEIDTGETVRLIQTAMKELGITQITAIGGTYTKMQTARSDSAQEILSGEVQNKEARILALYKKICGAVLSPEVKLQSGEEVQKIKKAVLDNFKEAQLQKAGQELCDKIEQAYASGNTAHNLIHALRTNRIRVPVSVFNKEDCLQAGMDEETYTLLQTYSIPSEKQELFSCVIFNLLLAEKELTGSGKTMAALIEAAYNDIVHGQKSEEVVSIETTFAELCRNPEKKLTEEKVEERTLQALQAAQEALPQQKSPEIQQAVTAAVQNVISNFSAVRMSTGMTAAEAVRFAAQIAGGKTDDAEGLPVIGIVYTKHAAQDDAVSAGKKRIFADIPVSRVIERAKNAPARTKEAVLQTEAIKDRIRTITVNMLDKKSREAFFKTQEFGASGISRALAEAYCASIQAGAEESAQCEIDTEMLKRCSKKYAPLNTVEKVAALFTECRVRPGAVKKQSLTVNSTNTGKLIQLLRESGCVKDDMEEVAVKTYCASIQAGAEESAQCEIDTVMLKRCSEKYAPLNTVEKIAALFTECRVRPEMAQTRTARVNVFNQAEREHWEHTPDFKKLGVTTAELEAVIQEKHTAYLAANEQELQLYSKERELDRQYGMIGEKADTGDARVPAVRIKTVTKIKGTAVVIAALTAQGHEKNRRAKERAAAVEYIPARIKADGKIGRHILGVAPQAAYESMYAVLHKNDAKRSARIISADNTEPFDYSGSSVKTGFSEHSNAAERAAGKSRAAGESYTDIYDVYNGTQTSDIQTPSDADAAVRSEYTAHGKNNHAEEARIARMQENYVHDKAVLAKEDPLFAKNRFWDIGHAEESGEINRNTYNTLLGKLTEKTLEEIQNTYEKGRP